jgi:hypothetical protein
VPESELRERLAERRAARCRGVCDYCGREPSTTPCRFPARHHDERIGKRANVAQIVAEVAQERERAASKHGRQLDRRVKPGRGWHATGESIEAHARVRTDVLGAASWADIALEEVGEALQEREIGPLRTELVQCAAMFVAWVEAIDEGAS